MAVLLYLHFIKSPFSFLFIDGFLYPNIYAVKQLNSNSKLSKPIVGLISFVFGFDVISIKINIFPLTCFHFPFILSLCLIWNCGPGTGLCPVSLLFFDKSILSLTREKLISRQSQFIMLSTKKLVLIKPIINDGETIIRYTWKVS